MADDNMFNGTEYDGNDGVLEIAPDVEDNMWGNGDLEPNDRVGADGDIFDSGSSAADAFNQDVSGVSGVPVDDASVVSYDGGDNNNNTYNDQQQSLDNADNDSNKWNSGSIAGTVILSLVLAGLLGFLGWYIFAWTKNSTEKGKRYATLPGVPALATITTDTSAKCVDICKNNASCGGVTYQPQTKQCTLLPPGGQVVEDQTSEAWAKTPSSTTITSA